MAKKIYLIPGLGADGRVFDDLKIEGADTQVVEWLKPKSAEPIDRYTERLIDQLSETEEFALLGVSFGGIIAQEIAKKLKPKQLILVSTVTSRLEYPYSLKIAGATQAHRVLSGKLMRSLGGLSAARFFSIDQKENKALLKDIMLATDPQFLEWAVDAIMKWNGEHSLSVSPTRIHGIKDKIFPKRYLRSTEVHFLTGGHFIIKEKADQISSIVADILRS